MAGQVGNNAYSPFNCIYNTFMNGLELNQTVWIQHCLIFYLIMNTELHGVPRNMIVGKWFWMSSIYKFGLSVCLSVCLYPINVKTAEPIGPKFFVGHLGTPGNVYESSKFQIFVSIKIRSSINFLKFWKSANYFYFVLRCTQREHVQN